jgi:transcription elongation factor Elf1
MKVNSKYKKEGKTMICCGHCGLEQQVSKNDLTEPVDAYGEFIDIYFKDQEYSRLTKREEILMQKGQYSELANIYSLLEDIAKLNADKFLEEYETYKSPQDLESAEKWKETSEKYHNNSREIRDRLASKDLEDSPMEDAVYEEIEEQPININDGPQLPSTKPKRKVSLNEMLDDTGFLEF